MGKEKRTLIRPSMVIPEKTSGCSEGLDAFRFFLNTRYWN